MTRTATFYEAWSAGTGYLVGDITTESGVAYLCISAHTNHVPPNPTYWIAMAGGSGAVLSVFGRTGTVAAAAGDYYGVVAAAATGATAASQYVGATASGAPASGAHVKGDFVVDQTGSFWVCTVNGTPGTWVQVVAGGGGPPSGSAGGVLDGSYPNPGLAASVAGNGLAETSDVLSVNVDGSSVEISADALRVKAGGVTAAMLSTSVQAELTDGWTDDTARTWTYVSASTFTVTGDQTAVFQKGTRLKFTQTTVKYAIVVSAAFSTVTTVTILVNTDYTLANAAITANYYSYQESPQGYPDWFTWTPTYTGFAAAGDPTPGGCKISIRGQTAIIHYGQTATGTSNATTFTITVPVTQVNITGIGGRVATEGTDNGAGLTTPVLVRSAANSAVLSLFKDFGGTAWTAANAKGCSGFTIILQI